MLVILAMLVMLVMLVMLAMLVMLVMVYSAKKKSTMKINYEKPAAAKNQPP